MIDARREAVEEIVRLVRRESGAKWLQGTRRPPISCRSTDPFVQLVANYRLHRVRDLECRALVGWVDGRRNADRYNRMLAPAEVVRLQAIGRRCVTLLPDGDPSSRLRFVLHDLRHLEKFFDPETYRAQVGYFRVMADAVDTEEWRAFDAQLDDRWRVDRDYALADMNGSPIFLFGYLKMKLKMAARRRLAEKRGGHVTKGPLDPEELQAYAALLESLLDLLEFPRAVQNAARIVTARGENGASGGEFLTFLERRAGGARLQGSFSMSVFP